MAWFVYLSVYLIGQGISQPPRVLFPAVSCRNSSIYAALDPYVGNVSNHESCALICFHHLLAVEIVGRVENVWVLLYFAFSFLFSAPQGSVIDIHHHIHVLYQPLNQPKLDQTRLLI